LLRPRRVRAHSRSRNTLTSILSHSRHAHSLSSYVRKSIDYKVNKENGKLYFKTVNSNYNSNSLSPIPTKRTLFFIVLHCLLRAQISFPALKALQRNTAPLLLRLSSRQSRLLEFNASSCSTWTAVSGF